MTVVSLMQATEKAFAEGRFPFPSVVLGIVARIEHQYDNVGARNITNNGDGEKVKLKVSRQYERPIRRMHERRRLRCELTPVANELVDGIGHPASLRANEAVRKGRCGRSSAARQMPVLFLGRRELLCCRWL
jgi:hypothetical protein